MIKFGTVEGAVERITQLRAILSNLGPSGSLTLDCPSGKKTVQITDSVSLVFTAPITIDYEITDKLVIIKFRDPHPAGWFKVAKRGVAGVTVSTSRIEIQLDWFPDGYIEVKS